MDGDNAKGGGDEKKKEQSFREIRRHKTAERLNNNNEGDKRGTSKKGKYGYRNSIRNRHREITKTVKRE